jgi:replicative DNA helicase
MPASGRPIAKVRRIYEDRQCIGQTLVLAVDSLQAARGSTRETREEVNAMTMALKDIGKKTGALVIVTSTVGRASYRKSAKPDVCRPRLLVRVPTV